VERITKQRRAILDCLTKTTRPLSIEEILGEVISQVPTINLSTLYRNLKTLIVHGEVQVHELAGHPPRYTLARAEHIHHFLCQSCDRLFTIPLCPKDINSMVPTGFVMYGHSITLNGLCKECRK
jgi:Fur family transcriptional regulator, ferric uptake regulator